MFSAFYMDIGTSLIQKNSFFNTNFQELKEEYCIEQGLMHHEKKKMNFMRGFEYEIDSNVGDLTDLKNFLMSKKPYILNMFENPKAIRKNPFSDNNIIFK